MNIAVCMKFTPDAADIQVRPDGSISLERAELELGQFDLKALEAGVRLAEAIPGSKVTVLSAGPRSIDNSKLRKDVLSRGPDELVLLADDALSDADTHVTALALSAALRHTGGADLVLCGEGSSDLYFQQAGLQLGELMGLPTLNAVSKVESEGDHLLVERSLEEEVEVIEVPLPAVLSVTTDIAEPRLPTMKEILKASKKTVTVLTLAEVGAGAAVQRRMETVSTRAPHQVQRKQVVIKGTPEEAAQSLVAYLAREGII